MLAETVKVISILGTFASPVLRGEGGNELLFY